MRPEKSDFIIKIPDDITKQINKKNIDNTFLLCYNIRRIRDRFSIKIGGAYSTLEFSGFFQKVNCDAVKRFCGTFEKIQQQNRILLFSPLTKMPFCFIIVLY